MSRPPLDASGVSFTPPRRATPMLAPTTGLSREQVGAWIVILLLGLCVVLAFYDLWLLLSAAG